MSEMVELVARAMAEKQRGWDVWDEISDDSDTDYIGKNEFRDLARAAIEAMREPTEMMMDAGHGEILEQSTLPVWQAMVDEALKTP
jgi:hypothetical protein